MKTKTLSTVNVIFQRDEVIESLAAFNDNSNGNLAAELLFAEWVKQEVKDVANWQLDAAVESGIFEYENIKIFLCHSTI